MSKSGGSRFLVRQLMVIDFWVAVRDLDQGTKAAFSARLWFQSIDRRLTLDCPKVEAAPIGWLRMAPLMSVSPRSVVFSLQKPAL